MKEKIIDGFFKVKSYWRKPPIGYDVSYKEITNFTVGFGSIGIISVLVQSTALAANVPLLISHFKANSGMIFILSMISAVIALLRAPILSMVIDNSNSKKGKFKPFLIWTASVSAICFTLIPFIPKAWVDLNIGSFVMPAIPVFGIFDASSVSMNLGLLLMFILMQIATTFHTLFMQAMTGIENTISTNTQERSGILAIKNLISNLPNSLVNIVLPLIAAALAVGTIFAQKGNTPMNNVVVYRIFFPLIAVCTILFAFVMHKGTNERMVINKKHVNRVKFWEGAKQLSKNKYFWIVVAFTIFSGVRGSANIYVYVCNYNIGGTAGATMLSICNMVLNNAFIPGLLLAPMLIKKFGKTKVMTVANVGFAVMTLLQLLLLFNPYTTLIGIFFQNLCLSVGFISSLMACDVLDYQQYKTNNRLEGFWHNNLAIFVTIAGLFTGILSPIAFAAAGINFGDSIDEAMRNEVLRNSALRNQTYIAIVGAILSIIPMLFYDLSEYKHKSIIRSLKLRKAVENFHDGALEDKDIIELNAVMQYIDEVKAFEASGGAGLSKKQIKELAASKFIKEEYAKYKQVDIDAILKLYPEAKIRLDAQNEQQLLQELQRNIEFEEKLVSFKVANAVKKAANEVSAIAKDGQKGKKLKVIKYANFSEEAYRAELIEKSRFIKRKSELEKLVPVERVDEVVVNKVDNLISESLDENKIIAEGVVATTEGKATASTVKELLNEATATVDADGHKTLVDVKIKGDTKSALNEEKLKTKNATLSKDDIKDEKKNTKK